MKKTYNWAILGCGKIARKFSLDLKLLPNANLYAAASRDLAKAQEFATELGFEKAYGSYEEMVDDPLVDVVYVATPHSHHRDHTLICLNHKKAVLCEKAFALNTRQVSDMVDAARANNTFLMEAFWTPFHPSFKKAFEIIRSGELGEAKMVRSDFAFSSPKDADNRLLNLSLGGGSLLDIGIYPVFAALAVLGKPDRIKALAQFNDSGAEESMAVSFKYNNGALASLSSSFASWSPVLTEFWCEKGYIRANRRPSSGPALVIWREGAASEEVVELPVTEGMGYQFEAAHVMDCLDAGKTESDVLPLSFSLDLIETLDRIRHDVGAMYPGVD
jgi:predicted dehydrogenase